MIMDVKEVNFSKNEKGQGLIEFVIFLPFMIFLYAIVFSIGSSINGSINQQKVTRGYFYSRLKNNSTFPKPEDGTFKNWQRFGMIFVGFKEKFSAGGDVPQAPCYSLKIPLVGSEGEVCEETYSGKQTKFIRVYTVYGLCGATYILDQSNFAQRVPAAVGRADCQIQ